MTFVAGSALLGVSIGFNAITLHGICTAGFVAIAAAVTLALASIQTLGRISWLGWVGVISILGAILTLTVAVGLQDRPSEAPATGPWDKNLLITNDPSFVEAIAAVSALVFSYAGTPCFFPIVSEMRDPRLYNRAMYTCQGVVTVAYLVTLMLFDL